MTIAEYAQLGGFEGAEVIMWLVMRGALSPKVSKLHQAYYLPSMTAIATVIYENDLRRRRRTRRVDRVPRSASAAVATASRSSTGTYPFTLERSVKAYRLNKFLHGLIEPEHRERFLRRSGGRCSRRPS